MVDTSEVAAAADAMREKRRQIPEPCLTVDLEDSAERIGEHEWYAAALIELSRQLGVGNDYYFPLCDAAEILKPKRVAYPFFPMGA